MKQTLIFLLIALFAPKALTAQEIYSVLSSDKLKLTFYYDSEKDSRSGTVYENSMADFGGEKLFQWFACHETVNTVIMDESMKAARPWRLPKTCSETVPIL